MLAMTGLASSKSEARRLVEQKGVKIDGQVAGMSVIVLDGKKEVLLQVGKRKFLKVR